MYHAGIPNTPENHHKVEMNNLKSKIWIYMFERQMQEISFEEISKNIAEGILRKYNYSQDFLKEALGELVQNQDLTKTKREAYVFSAHDKFN